MGLKGKKSEDLSHEHDSDDSCGEEEEVHITQCRLISKNK